MFFDYLRSILILQISIDSLLPIEIPQENSFKKDGGHTGSRDRREVEYFHGFVSESRVYKPERTVKRWSW